MDISCIAGLMVHEAVHAWIKYKTGNREVSATGGVGANEQLLADQIALEITGDPTGLFSKHINSQKKSNACNISGYFICGDPVDTVESAYGIDLSDLSVSISP
jgi:hypothetical protein